MMKKIFVRAAMLFLGVTLALTGCNSNVGFSDPEGESFTTENSTVSTDETTLLTESTSEKVKPATQAETTSKAETTEQTDDTNFQTSTAGQTEKSETETGETAAADETAAPTESKTEAPKEMVPAITTITTTATAATTTAQQTAAPKTQSVSTPVAQSGAFESEWKVNSTWQENGRFCGSCELILTNKTGTKTESWTVKMTVPNDFQITASWNGKFSLNGTELIVVNESYNGNLDNGANTVLGFNYSSPTDFAPPAVIVNGTAANSSGNNQPTNTGNNANDQTAATSAAELPAPLPAPAVIGLVEKHGRLSVKGSQLVDCNGNNFQLKGMSTHGLSWFPDFVNKDAFKTLRDDWNINAVRLAMYTAEYGGYCSGGSQSDLKALIDKGVQAAAELGMYVIIDWHILSDGNPQTYKNEAIRFFDEMSSKYKNYDNVLYEICNEPNGGVDWSRDIKPYAEEVIAVIRKNAPDSVVIVGTPTWSQDIDKAAADPISEDNVLYALHFYAATHTDFLRQRLTDCYNKGLPVFVSEFGTCDASGGGANDFGQSKQWLELLDSYGISYMNWNLANKNETCSAFKESASANGNWSDSDFSESGRWIRKWFRGEL